MAAFQPAFLPIGTEVSAKYRGAFCEAKVKKTIKVVKLKIILKESQAPVLIDDVHIVTGNMKVGNNVEFKHPDTSQVMEGVIGKITDHSTYTVVFNDGDERTLRRTQLCLKGDKHFEESETLDNLPLSHPEHFGTPVLKKQKNGRGRIGESGSEKEGSSSEDEAPRRESYKSRHQELVGKVMLVETMDKRKGALTPVLVVLPDAHPLELKNRDHLLVRSFRDTKFMGVNRKDLKDFSREIAIKNEDKAMKAAFEKALLYYDGSELPVNWNREELLGPEEDDGDDGDETSDDEEQCEEKDRFVAQLYKFMDDRGTPINKGPCIGNKDLNLYRLFRIVQNIGGYNKATNQMKWRLVYSKMGLPPSNSAAHQIKNAYKKYLHAFEDFYRKLGSIMGTISRPGRQSRQSSGRGILSFRSREKDSSPRSPRTEKPVAKEEKQPSKEEEKPKSKVDEPSPSEEATSVNETTVPEELDLDVVRRSTPRREKAQKEEPKLDKKDDIKVKKEEEKKEEPVKEDKKKEEAVRDDKKKEDKREERKSLRQSQKEKEDEKKESSTKVKEEEKKDVKEVKKEEGKTDRVLRKDQNEKDEETKKEPEDLKDAQKKRVTRRKSNRMDEDKKDVEEKEEDEEDKNDDKKKDKKEDRKEDKKDDKKEKKLPITIKKDRIPKKKPEEEEGEPKEGESDDESEEDSSAPESQDQDDLPLGTKLKVRYGRGRNQKIYEAKVVEHGGEGPRKNYLVHYAGWNTRYDEWVRSDRIVAVVDKPESAKQKRKNLAAKAAKLSATPPGAKSESSLMKKRGRQMFIQVPSPGGSITKPLLASMATDPKMSKNKAALTLATAASKTRSTRSNSTEIKPEAFVPNASKPRITRRSSGLNESAGESVHGETEGGSESDLESESAQASANGDVMFDQDEDEGPKESEMDTSMEEHESSSPFREHDMDSKSGPSEDDDCGMLKAEDMHGDIEQEMMPEIVPIAEFQGEMASFPDMKASTLAGLTSSKDSCEIVVEPSKDLPNLQEPIIMFVEEEKKESSKPEDSALVLIKDKDEVAIRENSKVELEDEVTSGDPTTSLLDKLDSERVVPLDDPSIPQLKKIDLDIPPSDHKKDCKEKEKVKSGKKTGRDSKKSRQNEMRSSLSEIPTLEPMTTPNEVKPSAVNITPSPYDFNDADTDSPSAWQPEITKKWEPNYKPLPAFRGVKMELKKSLETEKKKVKKKLKKPAEDPSCEGDKMTSAELPAKPAEKLKDSVPAAEPPSDKPPIKKKGRKKKAADTEVKMDTSSYEETVNSVVESCKTDDFVDVLLPVPLEPKEDKLLKKRKNKVLESSMPTKNSEKNIEGDRKDPAKSVKALKGKINRKKMKASENVEEQAADPIPLPFTPFDSLTYPYISQQEQQPSLQSSEPVPAKQPRFDADALPASSMTASLPDPCTAVPKIGPSGAHLYSMASIRPVPSTSVAVECGPSERLIPSFEDHIETVVKQSEAEPLVNCARELPKATCAVGSTVLDNTPPTTPENDLDEANSASSSSEGQDNLKEDLFSLDSGERTSKGGSESPLGCDFSLSSTSSENLPSSSNCGQSSGKASQSPETVSSKRKGKDDASVPVKKKKRLISRGSRGDRNKKNPKYGDEDSQSRSPLHQNGADAGLVPTGTHDIEKSSTPRPPKFHFADDLGLHLKGEQRIQFLLDKMKEIRKVYQSIRSEVAAIDRKRKRARRREKERESSQVSAGEKEAS